MIRLILRARESIVGIILRAIRWYSINIIQQIMKGGNTQGEPQNCTGNFSKFNL